MAGGMYPPVSKGVSHQIEARKKVIEKKVGRTKEDLLYLNSKTSWIKLSSSVNNLTPTQITQLTKGQDPKTLLGVNTKAKSNILLGGTLSPSGGMRHGIATGAFDSNAAYNNRRETTGIRPMPGITSMNVQSKNTYGTLREAEVKFICWTLEDFEIMEEIYLRPGFSVLLEWGHSLYLTNSGTLSKTVETVGDYFFNTGTTMPRVLDDIARIREASDNNYEGMVGYIKNFSWNYNAEGGYECTVSIISSGEILESLQIRFDPAHRVPTDTFDPADTAEGKEQRKSIYHAIISKMQKLSQEGSFNINTIRKQIGELGTDLLEDHLIYHQIVKLDSDSFLSFDTKIGMYWIPLRFYFDIFNKLITPVDTTKSKGTSGRESAKFNTDYSKSSSFLTSPEHFSIDPTVCVLTYPAKLYSGQEVRVKIPQGGIKPAGTLDDVLNIYISLPYLKSVLDGALDADGKVGKSMYDITESLLEGINTALGGVNDLGLMYDEEDQGGTWYLVDRNNTPGENGDRPVFTLAGIGSIFTEVGISSKISNEIASQISIAAQASANNTSENIENLLKWNPGVVDRLRVIKTTVDYQANADAANAKEEQEKRVQTWLDDVVELFSNFNESKYTKGEMQAIKTLHSEWTITNVIKKYRTSNKQPTPGAVPIELSFKLDGIAGLIVAQTFKIGAGILPSRYQDEFGYIITGLEHSIEATNRWETSVKTQIYPIGKPTDEEVQSTKQSGTSQREEANQQAGISRTPFTTSVKKIASFGKVSNSVPVEARPVLDTIAYTEGTAGGTNNGYDTIVGFSKIPGWVETYTKGHPGILIQLPNINSASTAAGRYQFLKQTWNGKGALTFGKSNQDLVGWSLVRNQAAVKSSYSVAKLQIQGNRVDVKSNPGFLSFLDNNYGIWASLVNSSGKSRYDKQNGGMTPADIYKVYIEAVKKYT